MNKQIKMKKIYIYSNENIPKCSKTISLQNTSAFFSHINLPENYGKVQSKCVYVLHMAM